MARKTTKVTPTTSRRKYAAGGSVTSEDILKMAVGRIPTNMQYDINKDGEITAADAYQHAKNLKKAAGTSAPAAASNPVSRQEAAAQRLAATRAKAVERRAAMQQQAAARKEAAAQRLADTRAKMASKRASLGLAKGGSVKKKVAAKKGKK